MPAWHLYQTEIQIKEEPSQFELYVVEWGAVGITTEGPVTLPVLCLPRRDAQYTGEEYACDTKEGFLLQQEQNNRVLKPGPYWSRSPCNAKKQYDTTDKVCLAVAWAIPQLCLYLLDTHFVVRADHTFFSWILKLEELTGRLERWQLHLIVFSFQFAHQPGAHQEAADVTSCVSKASLEKGEGSRVDIYNGISTYCILRQVSDGESIA